jgi:phenylacetate-CoA ligase
MLNRIVGRQRNMVVRPDGVRHWPSFPSESWRDVAPILQIQLVQDAIDHIEARLVLRRALAGDEGTRLIAVLQDCLDYPFNITLSQVDDIPPGAGNKYEDFVSLLAG